MDRKEADWKKYRNRAWLILNIIFTLIYLIWRIFFTVPLEYGLISAIAGVALITVEILGAFEAGVHFFNMNKVESHPVPEVPLELFPDVDVFIATYKEPVDLLYKTVNGCVYMDYPDKSKVHIYLCDDGNRPEVNELAKKFGINYLARTTNENAKAGNLNNAMKNSNSPLVVTFDSDMIPQHNFLIRTVPFFVDAEMKNRERADNEKIKVGFVESAHRKLESKDKIKIGFVQTPQSFYNPDLFQFNLFSENKIPNEQDYFYKDIQVSRNKTNSVIYGGSNTVLSRQAIEEIGGFYTKSITEDFATGILMQKKGYTCYAVNEVLASGLSPNDLKSLIKQRNRWARGVIASGRKLNILFTPKLKTGQRINYLASIWYWYAPVKRLIYFLSPLLFAVFGYMVIKCNIFQILVFWLPMYITSNISLRMLSRNIRTTKWTSVYETVLFPFMIAPVILESFGITLKKFNVTQKEAEGQKINIVYAIPFFLLEVLSVIGIVNIIFMMIASNGIGQVVILFWLIANLFTLTLSTFFILGRQLHRKSERVLATINCEIYDGFKIIKTTTKDISEQGISVLFENPEDIDDTVSVQIDLETDRYKARLKAKIVYITQNEEGWKYAFVITDTCNTFNEYLQMLYDRVPTLPQNLAQDNSNFNDLRYNLSNRTKNPFLEKRQLPRIVMNAVVIDSYGEKHEISDFNYKYISIKGEANNKKLKLDVVPGLFFNCSYERQLREGLRLYSVDNYNEIHENMILRSIRDRWVNEHIDKGTSNKPKGSSGEKEKQEQFEMKYV